MLLEASEKKKETEKKEIHDNIRSQRKRENAIFGMYMCVCVYARNKKGNELYFMLLKSV